MSKHTPGPWRVGADGTTAYDADGFSVASADDVYGILENWESTGAEHWSRRPGETHVERTEDEADANAALIAASPDLLEALRDLVRFTEEQDAAIAAVVGEWGDDHLRAARAAIAKAEGR